MIVQAYAYYITVSNQSLSVAGQSWKVKLTIVRHLDINNRQQFMLPNFRIPNWHPKLTMNQSHVQSWLMRNRQPWIPQTVHCLETSLCSVYIKHSAYSFIRHIYTSIYKRTSN